MMWRHDCSHDCMIAALRFKNENKIYTLLCKTACRQGGRSSNTRVHTNTYTQPSRSQPSVGASSASIAPSTFDPFILCTCLCVGQTPNRRLELLHHCTITYTRALYTYIYIATRPHARTQPTPNSSNLITLPPNRRAWGGLGLAHPTISAALRRPNAGIHAPISHVPDRQTSPLLQIP